MRRWQSHRENHDHKYGTVLFTCDAERAAELEGIAIRVLQKLKRYGTLCVGNANVAGGGGGGFPATDYAVIYMTWRTDAPPTEYTKPGVDVIRFVAEQVSSEADFIVTPRQLETGLMALKRLKQRAKIDWYPD